MTSVADGGSGVGNGGRSNVVKTMKMVIVKVVVVKESYHL